MSLVSRWVVPLMLVLAVGDINDRSIAQVTPDDSLGNERSRLTPENIIRGGAQRGGNLFHSFTEFNVADGQQLYFANPSGVDRILTRVTGTTRSQILGTLGVQGNADLFLINPNGILFGPNAQLDVQGSFVATTASHLNFDDGLVFSATQPTPLLTIHTPLGLQYENRFAGIEAQQSRLGVPTGKTLALLGGNIVLDGATLTAAGGQIELGGLSASGTLGLAVAETLNFDFPASVAKAEVSLARSTLNVSTLTRGGSAILNARTIDIAQQSTVLAGINAAARDVSRQAGDIRLNATDAVRLTDRSFVLNLVAANAVGNAGNVHVTTRSLSLLGGAQLGATVLPAAQGKAGNVIVNASERVILDGASFSGESALFNTVAPRSIAAGGDLVVTTGSLSLTNGGRLTSSLFGTGIGGSIRVVASDAVVLDGVGIRGFSSAIVSQVASPGVGSGGDINITADSLALTNGAQLSTSTFGRGNAGSITIDADKAIVFDGRSSNGIPSGAFSSVEARATGRGGNITLLGDSFRLTNTAGLFASTNGQGDAGKILVQINNEALIATSGRILSTVESTGIGNGQEINLQARSLALTTNAQINAGTEGTGAAGRIQIAADRFDVTTGGQLRTTTASGGRAGDIAVQVSDRLTLTGDNSGFFANTTLDSTGRGGSIFVNANRLEIREAARIAVGSQGSGPGGDIRIQAVQSTLSDRAILSAETASTQGGNITLQNDRLLLLRNNSLISTSAGTAQAGGNGGSTIINSPFIVSALAENNDIRANAFTGNGGNITITAQGIFGIQFQPSETSQSDITASSQFGLEGVVTLNTPDLDPTQTTADLSTSLSTPPLAQGCRAQGSRSSSFVNTGRGGVPANPTAPLTADTLWQDLETQEAALTDQPADTDSRPTAPSADSQPIVEAQGWTRLPDGTIALTAQAARVIPRSIHVGSDRVACR